VDGHRRVACQEHAESDEVAPADCRRGEEPAGEYRANREYAGDLMRTAADGWASGEGVGGQENDGGDRQYLNEEFLMPKAA
jgi:hypothetical protein